MTTTPNSLILPQTVRTVSATVTGANTTYTGSSTPANAVLLFSAGTNGSILRRLKARPLYASGSTAFTATQAQLIKYSGSTVWLDDDASIVTQTMSPTTGAVACDFGYTDTLTRYLQSGFSFYVGIGVAWTPGVIFTADIGDF